MLAGWKTQRRHVKVRDTVDLNVISAVNSLCQTTEFPSDKIREMVRTHGEPAAVEILNRFYRDMIQRSDDPLLLLECLSSVTDFSLFEPDFIASLSDILFAITDSLDTSCDDVKLKFLFDSLRGLALYYANASSDESFFRDLTTKVSLLLNTFEGWSALEYEIILLFDVCLALQSYTSDIIIGKLLLLCFRPEPSVSCLALHVLRNCASDEKVGTRLITLFRRRNKDNALLTDLITALSSAVSNNNRDFVSALLSFLVELTNLSDGRENKFLAESSSFRESVRVLISDEVLYLPITIIFSQIVLKCHDLLIEPELADLSLSISQVDTMNLKTKEKYAFSTFFAYLVLHNSADLFLQYFRSFDFGNVLELWSALLAVGDDPSVIDSINRAWECLRQYSLVI